MCNKKLKYFLPCIIYIIAAIASLQCGDGLGVLLEDPDDMKQQNIDMMGDDNIITEVPAIPLHITASAGSYEDRIVIAWDAAEGALVYYIYRSESEAGEYLEIDSVNADYTEYSDYDVLSGIIYYYKITSGNELGESDPGDPVQGYLYIEAPAAPLNVAASDGVYPHKIEVTWDAVSDVTLYYIYRSESESGPYIEIATADNAVCLYNDTAEELQDEVTYWYKVKSWNPGGHSGFSESDSGYVDF